MSMMTIQQTSMQCIVDIPADRRLVLDLPDTVPSGQTSVRLIFTPINAARQPARSETCPQDAPPPPAQNHDNPPLDLREARMHIAFAAMRQDKSGDSSRKFAGCLKGKNIFKGDPVAIQRKMRNEW
jgi:hypothetical protein